MNTLDLQIGPPPPRPAGMRRRVGSGRGLAFTLVELLVVISIIAVLASLTVGMSGVAVRKSRESRMRADLQRLVSLIEDYKARIGYYPPSSDVLVADRTGVMRPSAVNPLFYELGGTIFTNSSGGVFYPLSRGISGGLRAADITAVFGNDGFANSARQRRDVKATAEFRPSEVRMLRRANAGSPAIEVLVTPVAPPTKVLAGGPVTVDTTTGPAYPWYYDSTSTNRINADGFDLWAEVVIGNKIVRFSNWESGPVVLDR